MYLLIFAIYFMLNVFKMLTGLIGLAFACCACSAATPSSDESQTNNQTMNTETIEASAKLDTATFAAGCFWCVEAVFQQLDGVKKVISGYTGGQIINPTYKQVCTGLSGHAEACQVIYDPSKVNYETLLQAFWSSHDPTTLNRQGNDVGTQYRSAIFYHNEQQRLLAVKYKADLDRSGAYEKPIVTEISPDTTFYVAEDYHQNYYNQNKTEGYCQYVIRPKIEKIQKVFKDKLVKGK